MGMGDNIGNWYYPPGDSPDGSTLVPTSDPNNTVPYQSLKCTNQIGLVVDGDVTNNQSMYHYYHRVKEALKSHGCVFRQCVQ